ncbi:hypothetical protein L227DRAFT_563327 [Lentinus tigrinus ALCF2SS1-6]|uniref:DUF6532 domain-containing protein n=1 Tax=Lentinus tigrinus ALCF2SS1-6 TaxID=1328759 RepID=A0A5C2SCJ9_9APHY|nr:hypothetical protein L227DRAFT_563327 [Lentinus tigrinus ALCF2SS1-6]
MAPRPRPIKKKTAHLVDDPLDGTPAPPAGSATASPDETSGPPLNKRRTRASAAAATQGEAKPGNQQAASPSNGQISSENPPVAKPKNPRQSQPSATSTQTQQAPNGKPMLSHKRASSGATQKQLGAPPKKKAKPPAVERLTMSQGPTKRGRAEAKKELRHGSAVYAPPIEYATSSCDEEIALAVKSTRAARKPAASAKVQGDNTDAPDTDPEGERDGSDAEGAANAGLGPSDEEEGELSASSDDLPSDGEALAAQFAAERAHWNANYEPVRTPEDGHSSEYEYDTDDEEEQEMMAHLNRRAICEKEYKKLPPLLPPTAAHPEQPIWKPTQPQDDAHQMPTMVMSAHADNNSDDDNDNNDNNAEPEDNVNAANAPPTPFMGPDVQPPAMYAIIMPNGHGVVNLTAQHEHTRKIVRDALPILEAKLTFENVFPNAITLAQEVRNTLINVANAAGYSGLEHALRYNPQVSGPVAVIVKQRMSTFRGNVKKTADTHVTAFYSLKPGCAALVAALFDHLAYNYVFTWDPTANKLQVSWNKPYGHAIYPAMLHTCFFNGSSSMAAKNPDLFCSSLDARPQEKEIPIPMLAFVGAAIHAALSEWRSGNQAHVSFSADGFLDVYNEHKLLLVGIKNKNLRAFHKMMHRLY